MPPTVQNLYTILVDPTRRALFERLAAEGEHTVHELTLQSGVSQPAVSKHLRLLKLGGLVLDRRQGRESYYRAVPRGLLPLNHWMNVYVVHFD